MKLKWIKDMIEQIEKIAGSCFYYEDEDDIMEIVEEGGVLELLLDDYPNLGVEIDAETYKLSLFRVFSFFDIKKRDLEKGYYSVDEIEQEERELLLQHCFELYLKTRSSKYVLNVWDDGNYMCPGANIRVGFSSETYSKELVEEFLQLCCDFTENIEPLCDTELRKIIVKGICAIQGVHVTDNENIWIGGEAYISLTENENTLWNNIEHYYRGRQWFLISVGGQHYATNSCPINVFLDACSMCELFDETAFCSDGRILKVISKHMELSVNVSKDLNNVYSQREETSSILEVKSFVPFASKKFKEAFGKAYSNVFEIYAGDAPLVITEGMTDWQHLKKYWDQYESHHSKEKISFLEYAPTNSNDDTLLKLEMGGSALLDMCRAFSKIEQEKPFIFVADRDEPKIVKEMGGEEQGYKKWGNNVYSFVLPIPLHRVKTPEICIEHYYTDDEIKTFHICKDGIARRLFLGNDFDSYGRNFVDGLLCTKRNLCGEKSIRIIDGASDSAVVSMKERGNTNYALSKKAFAENATVKYGSTTYEAFHEVFEVIRKILKNTKE